MIAFPGVCDALVTALTQATGVLVFDGPPARMVGSSGISVGATREDIVSEWLAPATSLDGLSGEDLTIACLAWSGGGGVVFKPHRDVVGGLLDLVIQRLTADPTVGGAVSRTEVAGGSWTQEQTGEGALVTVEFRVSLHRF